MSKTESKVDEFDPDEYRGPADVTESKVDVANEDHPIKQAYGDSEHREFGYDPRRTGERFAFRYDSVVAWLREYLSNHQTACVRAGRYKLVEETDLSQDDVDEMAPLEVLRLSEELCDYHPVIEVAHAHKEADRADLVTSDNGIGISVREYKLVEEVGLSGSNGNGIDLGTFGQGLMSGFMAVGKQGQFEWHTESLQDGANYGERMRITGQNDLNGKRESPGTTFRFPAVVQEVHDLDIYEELERLQQGYLVDIVYVEYDADGKLVAEQCEEWGYESLADQLPEDYPVIEYEDEYVEAVTSPAVNRGSRHDEGSRDPNTFLISQPIERNEGASNNYSHSSPWHFDLRLKYESGPVYRCECEREDHVGLVPLDRPAYESLDEDDKADYVRKDRLGDDAVMRSPVDDKDRLESGDRRFFKEVAQELHEQYEQRASELFGRVAEDGIEVVQEFDESELRLFTKAKNDFGSNFRKASPKTIVRELEEELGVEMSEDVAGRLGYLDKTVSLAPRSRSANNISLKRHRDKETVQSVLQKSEGGTVYMAKSVNTDKTKLAWALDESNQVVQVNSYQIYEERFGWEKLKDLSLYDIVDTYDAIDENHPVANLDRRNRDISSSSSSSSGTKSSIFSGSVDGLDPARRDIKVRVGSGAAKYMRTKRGSVVFDLFDEDDRSIRVNGNTIDRLVLYDQREHPMDVGGEAAAFGVGYVVVPAYVYEYLLDADRVYESTEQALEDHPDPVVTTYPISQALNDDGEFYDPKDDDCPTTVQTGDARLSALDDRTCILSMPEQRLDEVTTMFAGETEYVDESAMGQYLAAMVGSVRQFDTESYDTLVLVSADTAKRGALHLAGESDMQPESPKNEDSDAPLHVCLSGGLTTNVYYNWWTSRSPVDVEQIALDRKKKQGYPEERFPRDATEWRDILEPKSLEDHKFEMLDALDEYFPDEGTAFPSTRGVGVFDTSTFDREGADAAEWNVLKPSRNYNDREMAKTELMRVLGDAGYFEGETDDE